MGITTLIYFMGFLLFIGSLIALKKWMIMPPTQKNKVAVIVLCTVLILLVLFALLVLFDIINFDGAFAISLGMLFYFLFILFTALFLMWYNDKYSKKVNVGVVVIILCLMAFGGTVLYLKNTGSFDQKNIIQNIALKTVVTNITFDTHKPYFKDMSLADGKILPMPETMNTSLQIGDSIYKNKNENFYIVINNKTTIKTLHFVKVHVRLLGKAFQN